MQRSSDCIYKRRLSRKYSGLNLISFHWRTSHLSLHLIRPGQMEPILNSPHDQWSKILVTEGGNIIQLGTSLSYTLVPWYHGTLVLVQTLTIEDLYHHISSASHLTTDVFRLTLLLNNLDSLKFSFFQN